MSLEMRTKEIDQVRGASFRHVGLSTQSTCFQTLSGRHIDAVSKLDSIFEQQKDAER